MSDKQSKPMGPRMYREELSLVMNAERSGRKLPLCPSCAQSMRLIRRTQRFGTLPDVCTFECRGYGVSHFEEYEPPKRPWNSIGFHTGSAVLKPSGAKGDESDYRKSKTSHR
jgi:hypothetical protein